MLPLADSDWAERATQVLTETFLALGEAMEHGWFRSDGGALAGVTGSSLPTLNGVWATGDADPDVIGRLLEEVASEGVPHCLQLRQSASALLAVAARRGMVAAGAIPLMVLDDVDAVHASAGAANLSWSKVSPGHLETYLQLLATGFEVPVAAMAAFFTRGILASPQLDCFIGSESGEPVTTGLAYTIGDACGIFNIATPPEYRGRGFGLAVTAHCLQTASQRGARWAYLQSSEIGFSVYQRLGFHTVEQWPLWVSQP